MKIFSSFILSVFFAACAGGTTSTYIGSTPAAAVIRSFLGIPLSDSVDFIRWKLVVEDDQFGLQCNYGLSKPNTGGFINGGTGISLTGSCSREKNYYRLRAGAKKVNVARVNDDLLYLLDGDDHLLVGNGGWSYALNSTSPAGTERTNLIAPPTVFKDSMAFDGRTPCGVPGIIAPGSLCYKLKWSVTLYSNETYKVLGTPWRSQGGRSGNWKMTTGKDGRTVYRLNDEKGNGFIYLLKLDDNIMIFTDATGKLLVGDENFSYMLNRR